MLFAYRLPLLCHVAVIGDFPNIIYGRHRQDRRNNNGMDLRDQRCISSRQYNVWNDDNDSHCPLSSLVTVLTYHCPQTYST